MKRIWKNLTAGLMIACLMATFAFVATAPAITVQAATQQRVVTIDNTGGDDNPFFRLYVKNTLCGTGGPFAISFEVRITDWKRMSGHTDSDAFVNTLHTKLSGAQAHFKGNTAWTKVQFSFQNITKTLIDGEMRDYALIDIGLYYVKAKLSVRNFTIINAAGKVVYSLDNDPDFKGITDMGNLAENNPEPLWNPTGFGQSGAAKFLISYETANAMTAATTTTKGAAYENDATAKATTTTKAKETNSAVVSGTTALQGNESSTDSTSGASNGSSAPDLGNTTVDQVDSFQTGVTTAPQTILVKKLNVGAVIGIVAGIVVVLAAAGVAVWLLLKRRKKQAVAPDLAPDQTDEHKNV